MLSSNTYARLDAEHTAKLEKVVHAQVLRYIDKYFVRTHTPWPTYTGNKPFPHAQVKSVNHILRDFTVYFGPWVLHYTHKCRHCPMGRHGGCIDIKWGVGFNSDFTWWIVGLGRSSFTLNKVKKDV